MNGNLPTTGSDTGYYVYCVAELSAAETIIGERMPTPIEETAGVELIASNKLAAIVSQVLLSEYSEEGLAGKLTDASWTAIRAMRHEHVVEFFAKRTSVVPLRFGTIYLNKDRVEQMLTAQELHLKTILGRLEGSEEWGVNVYS